ncbi:MAG: phospholipase [Candidatus Delongbacteria bacterium]|nr:phospholipase [Candidatus Delongbacteria bacterium]
MKSILAIILCLAGVWMGRCSSPEDPVLTPVSYNYFVILPDHYDSTRIWPVIVFLHGQGGATMSLDIFKSYGLGDYADSAENFPFIIVAPQTYGLWYPDLTEKVIREVVTKYAVDTNRIYGTGFSLGGYGTIIWAIHYPERFAAIAPVAGWGRPDQACAIRDLPIWFFHNTGDPVIDSSQTRIMIDSLIACGASNLKVTWYPYDYHDAWSEAYHSPELYQWFLDHKRNEQGDQP